MQTLVRRIQEGDIDLQPDFQRQEVWTRAKKRKLIDTILRGWSIPPIHLVRTNDGQLEVLDGQQRLTAVRDFIDNQFSVDGRIEPLDDEVFALHGKFFKNLPDTARRQVQYFPIKCFTLTDFQPDEPSELFYRLNEPTMLTAGERRNALYGEARDQLKSLVDRMIDMGLDKDRLGFSNARLAYDDVLARLLIFLDHKDISEKSTESRVSERFRRGYPFSGGVVQRAEQCLYVFSKMKNSQPNLRMNKANLLSWLLFVSRDPQLYGIDQFFSKFYDGNAGKLDFHFIRDAMAVFDDRSRLRVADVSSVIYRDFCLWYVYYFSVSQTLPQGVRSDLIELVHDDARVRDDLTFESILQKRIIPNVWGYLF